MYLSESDQIIYLANVIFLANADKSFSTIRLSALDEIRGSVGAKKSQYDAAHKKALSGAYTPTMVTNFPAQVSNLADMLYIAIVDGELTANEKSIIQDFATLIKLTGEQSLLLTKEAIERAKSKQPGTCPACNTDVEGDASFCPKCGAPLKGADATVSTEFKIPQSGYSVEFCESTSASFPNAFKIAQSAPSFASCVRGKKTWYLASWPSEAFGSAVELAGALSGLRNRKSYLDGSEISWDQLFGFVWCAEKRKMAYRPVMSC